MAGRCFAVQTFGYQHDVPQAGHAASAFCIGCCMALSTVRSLPGRARRASTDGGSSWPRCSFGPPPLVGGLDM